MKPQSDKSSESLDLADFSLELFLFSRRLLLDVDYLVVGPFVKELQIFHFFYFAFKSLLLFHSYSFQIMIVSF